MENQVKKIVMSVLVAFALVVAQSLTAQAMEKMDHPKMNHGSMENSDTFTKMEMVDGFHVEFQVMDLASMNMKDPEGNTHHIMVSFMKDNNKLENIAGKVKVISPSGKEQIGTLTNYGSGVFAVNFTFNESGDWGVICLFKDGQQKHTVKFWYPHMMK